MTTDHDINLVLCATGKTGRRVVGRLEQVGVPVRASSRRSDPPFDWGDAATWPAVLDRVSAVYIVFTPDLAFPGAADQIAAFTATARASGVSKGVLLSGRGEPGARQSEAALQASGLDWTILRSSWFFQNFSENFLLPGVLDGVIALPAGDVTEPFIDAEDVAACAAEAMLRQAHCGRVYELTGPTLLGFAEVAQQLSDRLEQTVRYEPVTAAAYVTAAVRSGVPLDEAEAFAGLFATVLDGRNAATTADVEQILGRPASGFGGYVARTAATGVWGSAEATEASSVQR